MPGVIFRHTVEAMVQRVLLRRNLLTPALAQDLKALGLDVTRPHDVPLNVWKASLRHISRLMAPGKPEDEALEELGREVLRGYAETLVGKGTLLVAKMMGPRRALLRIGETWSTAGDAYKIAITEKSPTEIEALAEGVGDARALLQGRVSRIDAAHRARVSGAPRAAREWQLPLRVHVELIIRSTRR